MEWFFIEALFALAVGAAIVWWTMAPRKKLPRAEEPQTDTKSVANGVVDNSADAKSDAAPAVKNQ